MSPTDLSAWCSSQDPTKVSNPQVVVARIPDLGPKQSPLAPGLDINLKLGDCPQLSATVDQLENLIPLLYELLNTLKAQREQSKAMHLNYRQPFFPTYSTYCKYLESVRVKLQAGMQTLMILRSRARELSRLVDLEMRRDKQEFMVDSMFSPGQRADNLRVGRNDHFSE
ncbi:MAG: hypothetical protein Q9184_004113 [Pyrenodesmia sp. 2 TL-2023]